MGVHQSKTFELLQFEKRRVHLPIDSFCIFKASPSTYLTVPTNWVARTFSQRHDR